MAPDPPTGPRRLHPLSPVVTAALALARSWPVVLLAVARGVLGLLVVFAVALLVWRTLVWWRTTWEIGDDGLVVRSGILWRSTQVVPPPRVQQVEVTQQLRHRATGLAIVRIGLAGGGGRVELDALAAAEAAQLGARLESWRSTADRTGGADAPATAATAATVDGGGASAPDGSDAGNAAPLPPPAPHASPAPVTLVQVPAAQLVIAGLTSRSLWLGPLAAFAALVQLASDAGLSADRADTVAARIAEIPVAVLLVVVMVLALAIAAVTTVVSHHGLTVERVGDRVAVHRGFFERRSVQVPRRRVQYVVVRTNPVRRRLGLGALDVRTADPGRDDDQDGPSTSLPIGRLDALSAVVAQLLSATGPAVAHRHPAAAVRRAVVRRTVRVVPLAVLGGLLVAGPQGAVVAAPIGLVVGVVTGWATGRSLRTAWDTQAVVTERGAVAHRRVTVPIERVQSVAVLQDPFQRRLGLASVRLDVAGAPGGVTVVDLGLGDAVDLAAGALGPLVGPLVGPAVSEGRVDRDDPARRG